MKNKDSMPIPEDFTNLPFIPDSLEKIVIEFVDKVFFLSKKGEDRDFQINVSQENGKISFNFTVKPVTIDKVSVATARGKLGSLIIDMKRNFEDKETIRLDRLILTRLKEIEESLTKGVSHG